MTHIEIIRARHIAIADEIRMVLNWDELRYGQHIMDMGIAYLKKNLQLNDCAVNIMVTDRKFWNWWKIQWYNRESLFLEKVKEQNMPLIDRLHKHAMIHSPEYLEMYPHKAVMEDTYSEMVKEMITEIHKSTI
jgi:hypothetical protein